MAKRKPDGRDRHSEVRTRAMHVLAKMRRDKLSLAEACRLEHIKPDTFLKHVGSAVKQDKPDGITPGRATVSAGIFRFPRHWAQRPSRSTVVRKRRKSPTT